MNANTSSLRATVGAVLALVLCAPAFAQLTPAQEEAELAKMDCVFMAISDADVTALARAYETTGASAPDATKASMQKSTDACAARFGWTDEQKSLANEAALAGSVADILTSDLVTMGMKDIEPLIIAWEGLDLADLEALITDGWQENEPLAKRLTAKALAAGVPDTKATVDKALNLFEAVTFGSLASEQWLSIAERRTDAATAQ